MIIAIDGHVATGKSTVAKLIAQKLGGFFASTGQIYRLCTYYMLKKGIDLNDSQAIAQNMSKFNFSIKKHNHQCFFLCNNEEVSSKHLMDNTISTQVSLVAQNKQVRQSLIKLQQSLSEVHQTMVVEGRDIGSVIFPNASYKFFMTATVEVRAKRRLKQINPQYDKAQLLEMIAQINKRDQIDTNRKCNPTKITNDAIIIDTSNKTIQEVVNQLIQYIK